MSLSSNQEINPKDINKFTTKLNFMVNSPSRQINITTHQMFGNLPIDDSVSPIDTFIASTKKLDIIISNYSLLHNVDTIEDVRRLVFLGYISSVETYFRGVIRKLVLVDFFSKKKVEEMSVSYGAAIVSNRNYLPDALLEEATFINKSNILDSLKAFIALKGHIPAHIDKSLEQYSIACQFRHCIVHRSGRLGSKNAIHLGLDDHAEFLQKRIKIESSHMNELSTVCLNLVKDMNNFLFNYVLVRSCLKVDLWKWNYNQDRKLFLSYHNIFYSTELNSIPSVPKDIYDKLKSELRKA